MKRDELIKLLSELPPDTEIIISKKNYKIDVQTTEINTLIGYAVFSDSGLDSAKASCHFVLKEWAESLADGKPFLDLTSPFIRPALLLGK